MLSRLAFTGVGRWTGWGAGAGLAATGAVGTFLPMRERRRATLDHSYNEEQVNIQSKRASLSFLKRQRTPSMNLEWSQPPKSRHQAMPTSLFSPAMGFTSMPKKTTWARTKSLLSGLAASYKMSQSELFTQPRSHRFAQPQRWRHRRSSKRHQRASPTNAE